VACQGTRRVVVLDANVLINLIIAERLELLNSLPGFEFVVPENVVAEIRYADQRASLDHAIERRFVRMVSVTDPFELELYARLRNRMGRGEAACIAMAQVRDWIVASDELGRFEREVAKRLGPGRLVNTPGLLVLGIQAGVLSVEEADRAKEDLERHRFKMRIGSFREVIDAEGDPP